jgi:hypothetical protein
MAGHCSGGHPCAPAERNAIALPLNVSYVCASRAWLDKLNNRFLSETDAKNGVQNGVYFRTASTPSIRERQSSNRWLQENPLLFF